MSFNQTQIRHSGAACVVGALAPYNHGVPLAGAGRNLAEKLNRVADRSEVLSCFARICAFNWIPAYAGMTK
jgi:hypothetical protein